MILVDELTKVIGYGCGLLTIMLGNISDRPVVDILGPHYCHMFDYLVNLTAFTGMIGGASIALLRLLFIKANHTLKYRLGLMPTTIVLMLVTHASSHIVTYLWITAPQPNRLIFLQQPQALSRNSLHLFFSFLLLVVVVVVGTLNEISMYVCLYHVYTCVYYYVSVYTCVYMCVYTCICH